MNFSAVTDDSVTVIISHGATVTALDYIQEIFELEKSNYFLIHVLTNNATFSI